MTRGHRADDLIVDEVADFDISEALDKIDIGKAMATAFGRCPDCEGDLVFGVWLQWCPKRRCTYVANRRAGSQGLHEDHN